MHSSLPFPRIEDKSAEISPELPEFKSSSVSTLSGKIYGFSPEAAEKFTCSLSNSDPSPRLHAGILLEDKEELLLEGRDSLLLCRGQMTAIALLHCRNITVKDLTVDWDIPLTAEGTVLASCDTYTDVSVDPIKYPHHIEGNALFFDGPGWSQQLHQWGHTEFDPAARCLARNRGDRFPPTTQQELRPGVIRFSGDFRDRRPTPGNILVLRHGDRIHPAILIHDCENIRLQNVRIHCSGGLGILAQFSDTLQFSGVQLVPNGQAGRQFAGCHDDGIHLSADRGEILIENCSFLGLMDDPVNLHGIAAKATMQPKGDTFRGKFMHPQSRGHLLWARPGDQVALLNGDTMEEMETLTVKNFRLLDDENFEIQFTSLISQSCSSFSLENISNAASLICRHNHFGSCRARGLLVCTPKPVLIEDNFFESPGAAIRIPGDVCTWYESGRCRDVTIHNNIFSDTCLSNVYQGGQGILSISPELPRPEADHPCHENISITRNHFHVSDPRVLYGLCVKNLRFTDNEIQKSPLYEEDCPPRFTLEHCTDAVIQDNLFLGF